MTDADRVVAGAGTLPSPAELLDLLREAADEVFTKMVTKVAVITDAHPGSTPPPTITSCAQGETVAIEAVVDFSGVPNGAVVLRCSMAGALDITRGLLMLGEDDAVELEDIEDALQECANMVSGALKSRAFDTIGVCRLHVPRIESFSGGSDDRHCGTLVYRLVDGCAAIEVWMEEVGAA